MDQNLQNVLAVVGALGLPSAIIAWLAFKADKAKDNEEKQERKLLEEREKGAHEEREKAMKADIDSAHKKIRDDVVPRITALEGSHRDTSKDFKYLADGMSKIEASVQKLIDVTQEMREDMAKGNDNGGKKE